MKILTKKKLKWSKFQNNCLMLLILVAIFITSWHNEHQKYNSSRHKYTLHIIIMYISLRIQGNEDSDREEIEME